jgi:hypothetical protein
MYTVSAVAFTLGRQATLIYPHLLRVFSPGSKRYAGANRFGIVPNILQVGVRPHWRCAEREHHHRRDPR